MPTELLLNLHKAIVSQREDKGAGRVGWAQGRENLQTSRRPWPSLDPCGSSPTESFFRGCWTDRKFLWKSWGSQLGTVGGFGVILGMSL